jgi:HAMP domain-containing protein
MDSQKPNSKVRFISLRVQVLVGFTLLFSVVFAGAYYWFYTFTTNAAMNRIQQDLVDTLQGAEAGLDVEQFLTLAKEGVPRADGYTDDPRYWEHVGWLARVEQVEPRAKVYTYIKGEQPKEVIFIGSGGAVLDPPFGAQFLEHYTSSGLGVANLLTGLDHVGVDPEIYDDEWGSWISGWGPITDSRGEKVGGIGVDFSASYVLEVQQGIRNSMFAAFAITYVTLFALVFLISQVLTQPIVTLTKAAERIGEGDYDHDFAAMQKGRVRNEISTLTEVFGIMVGKVYQREQTLIRKVEELKIEIDEVKRKKQVSEIVESDFFQDLQAKARSMRGRSRRPAQDAPGDEAS